MDPGVGPAAAAPAGVAGAPLAPPPRLGFLGVGWIGRHRMNAVARAGAGRVVAVADPSAEAARAARTDCAGATRCADLDELLAQEIDGLVIATPSALHAGQATAALRRGVAVFCQKPLARTAAEAAGVVRAAEAADRLLGVDLSYRHTRAFESVRGLAAGGALGRVFAVDAVFHNAYGPDKAWFRDPELSGGGCLIDLGVHLLDLAMELLGWPEAEEVSGSLYAGGRRLDARGGMRPAIVEDYAAAAVRCAGGALVRLACSWNLHAGRDAVIGVEVHGTEGGASVRNAGGSFYDFTAERLRGTAREVLVPPPPPADEWGGRAIVAWARRLRESPRFDPGVRRAVAVASIMDRIYGR